MKWSEWGMDDASEFSHVDVLEWWEDSGLEMKWSEDSMDCASANGHIAVLEWWNGSGSGDEMV